MRTMKQIFLTMIVAVVTTASLVMIGLPGTQVTQASSHRVRQPRPTEHGDRVSQFYPRPKSVGRTELLPVRR